MKPQQHLLNSASNLLGVALLIVTAVHITGRSARTISDEVAFASAILFIACCLASHRSISKSDDRFERLADKLFAAAMLVLLVAVFCFWF